MLFVRVLFPPLVNTLCRKMGVTHSLGIQHRRLWSTGKFRSKAAGQHGQGLGGGLARQRVSHPRISRTEQHRWISAQYLGSQQMFGLGVVGDNRVLGAVRTGVFPKAQIHACGGASTPKESTAAGIRRLRSASRRSPGSRRTGRSRCHLKARAYGSAAAGPVGRRVGLRGVRDRRRAKAAQPWRGRQRAQPASEPQPVESAAAAPSVAGAWRPCTTSPGQAVRGAEAPPTSWQMGRRGWSRAQQRASRAGTLANASTLVQTLLGLPTALTLRRAE